MVDASCNLEPTDFPKLLKNIRPLIDKGYAEAEIDALQNLLDATPVKGTGVKSFSIVYRGYSTPLRVELKKDDVDEIEIWFITVPQLAKDIQGEMKKFLR